MNLRSALLVTANLLIACSGNDGKSSNSSTVSPKPLFILSKGETMLTVYGDKLWELLDHTRCNHMDGELSDSKLASIKSYLSAIELTDKQCGDSQFSLLAGTSAKNHACWDEPVSTGMKGITQVYFDSKEQLDKMPMGMCNVNPPGLNAGPIKNQPNPPSHRTAGSGG